MNSKYFSFGFIGSVLIITLVLVVILIASSSENNFEISQIVWASIIFLFLILGITIITLYLSRISYKK